MKEDKRFPTKKAIISTIIIMMVSLLILTVLYTIAKYVSDVKYSWIYLLVWIVLTISTLATYWIRTIVIYKKEKNNNEK